MSGETKWPEEIRMAITGMGDMKVWEEGDPRDRWEEETYVPAQHYQEKLSDDDRLRLRSIAQSIEHAVSEGQLHPDFASRDARFLHRLAAIEEQRLSGESEPGTTTNPIGKLRLEQKHPPIEEQRA